MEVALAGILLFAFASAGDGRRNPEKHNFDEIGKLITFQLYTRENSYYGERLTLGDKDRLKSSDFKGNLPTVICTHGYLDSAKTSWVENTKKEYLKAEEVNFITLDYSTVSHNLLYDEVVKFTKTAGLYTGMFLKFLQTEGDFNIERTHLIGHSLGAHVLGFSAKAFPIKKTLGRITALDPAGPLFEHAPESDRLNSDCAKIVDVIHTCTFFVGTKKPIGTIDFYPNGGFNQPGCGVFDLTCNHARAREYFHHSIGKDNRNKYKARKCQTLRDAINGTCEGELATMGYSLNYRSPGVYYLKIN